MVGNEYWEELAEVLSGRSKDELVELCYVLELHRSGTKGELIERIGGSGYGVRHIEKRSDALIFGLVVMDYYSFSELTAIADTLGVKKYRNKWDTMVEIVKSGEISSSELLGALPRRKVERFYRDEFEEQPTEDWDRLIARIVGHYEVGWMDRIGDSGFIVMDMRGDSFLEKTNEVIKEECRRCGIEAIRVDDIATSGVITDEVNEKIEESEYIFVDLTGERPNVYYELGCRHGLNRDYEKIVLMARSDVTLHFDIRNMRVILYKDHEELREKLRERLEAMKGSE